MQSRDTPKYSHCAIFLPPRASARDTHARMHPRSDDEPLVPAAEPASCYAPAPPAARARGGAGYARERRRFYVLLVNRSVLL